MASSNKPTRPIISPDQERFMAFEGVLQWAHAVIQQSERLSAAYDGNRPAIDPTARHQAVRALHTECHFFVIAANKLIEYCDWARGFALFSTIDFSGIDQFSNGNIRDLRNMREHVVEYFQGAGHAPSRWIYETPEYKADASSLAGVMIGGRLDWVAFSAAVRRILPSLLAEPIPYHR
jgi:hypothetical protein